MMAPSIFRDDLFDNIFDGFFNFPAFDTNAMQKAQKELYGHHAANIMKTDVQEHEEHFDVDIDLPGFKKDELSLELKNGYLIVNASKGINKDEVEETSGKFVRRERYAGNMSRSFFIGEDVKQEDIHAKFEDGVLRLCIPKPAPKKPEIEDKKFIAIEG